ncbi:MAG: hypothetical protein MUF65_11210 [Rubritepida sp.]|jgi:hypothetical protein|nr:hypothetical protein [Rubritepida sp.]MCU0945923.1 hypothetical protein [Rubritepida sp.]
MRKLLLATAASLGLATGAHAANLVLNGSFESGFSHWTLTNPSSDAPAVAIFYNLAAGYPNGAYGEAVPTNNAATNSTDAPGTRAAYFVGDFARNETLSQSIFLDPGLYQIGFSAYLPANGQANRGEALFTGSIAGVALANFAASTQPGTTWSTFAGATTITTAGFYAVQFTFNTNLRPSKDVVVDQVYVIRGNPPVGGGDPAAVPVPAALGLFGVGLLGLGLLRRRG